MLIRGDCWIEWLQRPWAEGGNSGECSRISNEGCWCSAVCFFPRLENIALCIGVQFC
jgi:hypothetical protein